MVSDAVAASMTNPAMPPQRILLITCYLPFVK
jgi:hypothetical protein